MSIEFNFIDIEDWAIDLYLEALNDAHEDVRIIRADIEKRRWEDFEFYCRYGYFEETNL